MDVSELKLKIFRHVDALEKNKIQEFYGVLMNYLNKQNDIEDWNSLTHDEQESIENAILEIEEEKTIPHEEVISKYRNKYSHA